MGTAAAFIRSTAVKPAPTVDAFLGGRIEAVQTATGHRSGLEAILLAASVDSSAMGTVVDLGAGTGVCGFAVAARCTGATVVLAERDRAALECARVALERPANRAFANRVSLVAVDITAPEAARKNAGLSRDMADLVVVNPPFFASSDVRASPDEARAAAHVIDDTALDAWLRAATSVLKPHGVLTVIFHADGFDRLVASIKRRFGAIDVLPIHPRADRPAHRVLVGAVKGSRGGVRLLPPLVLHAETGNGYLPAVEAILRRGTDLRVVHPSWQNGR